MELEIYSGSDGLAQIQPDWEALEARTDCHIFQTFAYAQLWQTTVGEPSGATPLIAVVREGDTAVGIFPVCRVRVAGIPVLTWLGGPSLLDYGDVLFDTAASSVAVDEFIGTALTTLREHARGSLLYLVNVREDAQAMAALRARLRVYKESTAPYVEIGGDFDAYLRSLGKMRHEIERRRRRITEAGSVELGLLCPGDPRVGPTMQWLIDHQQERFKGHLGESRSREHRHAAYRMEQAVHDPHSRIATLSLDGTLIAALLHVVYRGRMYCLMPTFDTQYAQYAPGRLLQARVIEMCFEERLNPCDFGWGDEAYKYQWTKLDVSLTTFTSEGADGALLVAVAELARRIT